MAGVTENLAAVRGEIETAAKSVNPDPAAVTLIAVSKTFDAEAIRPVLQAGQRVFGENRVQEAEGKWPQLREEFPDVELHLIGPLQTNKVKHALPLFDVIQTVDRPKLARMLADQMEKTGHRPDCYIQVNTGEEEQKAGIPPSEVDAFVALCRDELNLPVVGLMCIPPVDEQPSPHFALLSKMAERNGLKNLSMGMSADFQTAVMLGATHVRVGSAIFGKRDYP
ncbi:YggS family pyridoxal phosphate-dependent enzyme [Hwanghaeella sp.]|uniref:YggS family pyridoxal phosphate-dependent enzyme n=1 Tax=Hwanghaeella sp. TaxID=2605943 RepID=UPI003CCB9E8C